MTVYEMTIFRVPMRWLAVIIYWCAGWKVEGKKPDLCKFVIIAAPHTSNWDFLYTLCLGFILRINPRIMMKNAWFFWPLGSFFRWLGAVPVDRSKSNNVVGQSIAAFEHRDDMALVVPPAGTRKKVAYWKTGFYHIAHGAGVPIVLGYLDYRRKAGGIGPTIQPTGDIEQDMAAIRGFYSGISGKYASRESLSRVAPQTRSL
jgi:1-acyl-sn-glycerol-3-phosphate acyltransferase